MIYSGLDWSGSPGIEPHDPRLVFAIVHLEGALLAELDERLVEARRALRLPSDYPFHHVGSAEATHMAFYEAILRVPFQARVLVVDKAAWTPDYLKRTRGPDRLCDGVLQLIGDCPDEVVANQRLFVDLRRKDMDQVRNLRIALRRSLAGVGRRTFGNIQPCPDHRIQGGLVQVADMIAGEVREQGGISGSFLRGLGAKVINV